MLLFEYKFGEDVRANGEKAKSQFIILIERLRSKDYTAFVHEEDGEWFKSALPRP
jgi:hypothetical protein